MLLIAGHPSETPAGKQQHGPSMLPLELAATSPDPHTLHFHTCHKRSGKVPRGRKKVMPFLPLLSHFVSRPIRLFREPCAILEPGRVTQRAGRMIFFFLMNWHEFAWFCHVSAHSVSVQVSVLRLLVKGANYILIKTIICRDRGQGTTVLPRSMRPIYSVC